MIKAYIFDLDGTLLDRDSSIKDYIINQHERLTPLHKANKEDFVDRFIELDSRGYVWKDRVFSQLVDEFNLDIDSEYLLQDYVRNFRNHCIGFTGLHDTLGFLQQNGARLGMITNGFWDVSPDEAFYIGDHPENDIRASRKFGMKAIWKEDKYYKDNFERDETIKDLIELIGIFKSSKTSRQ